MFIPRKIFRQIAPAVVGRRVGADSDNNNGRILSQNRAAPQAVSGHPNSGEHPRGALHLYSVQRLQTVYSRFRFSAQPLQVQRPGVEPRVGASRRNCRRLPQTHCWRRIMWPPAGSAASSDENIEKFRDVATGTALTRTLHLSLSRSKRRRKSRRAAAPAAGQPELIPTPNVTSALSTGISRAGKRVSLALIRASIAWHGGTGGHASEL